MASKNVLTFKLTSSTSTAEDITKVNIDVTELENDASLLITAYSNFVLFMSKLIDYSDENNRVLLKGFFTRLIESIDSEEGLDGFDPDSLDEEEVDERNSEIVSNIISKSMKKNSPKEVIDDPEALESFVEQINADEDFRKDVFKVYIIDLLQS